MKQLFYFFLIALCSIALAQESSSAYDLKVAVTRAGDRFQVSAGCEVSITLCEAFAFITDYEGAKNLPWLRSHY